MGKTLPSAFLIRAFRETRRIRSEIRSIEHTIQLIQEPKDESEFPIRELDEFSQRLSPHNDPELLQGFIDEHIPYQDYLIKHLNYLSMYIPSYYLTLYFDIVTRFDMEINKIDPTYPVLGNAYEED